MPKNEKNNKKSKREFIIALLLLAALLAAIAFFAFVLPGLTTDQTSKELPSDTSSEPSNAPSMPYDVPGFTMLEDVPGAQFENGLSVLCVGKFSGFYLEDMSDEQVRDVLSIIVRNNGDTMVEYGTIELPIDGETASFTFSGLPANKAILVQEKNRMTWSEQKTGSFVCTEYARPVLPVFDFGMDFELYHSDGVINIKNISGKDITSDVKVFYKNYEYGLFMGGITYQATFSGGIKDGEILQRLTEHYFEDTSVPLYMTYDK